MLATYHYVSAVGTFWIKPLPRRSGRFLLGVDETPLGSYVRPEDAARDVHAHRTSWREWDSLPAADEPVDLTAWQSGPPD